MLRSYRSRFIALNMCLIGLALLCVLASVSIYTYFDYRSELEKTMFQVLEPISSVPSDVEVKDFDKGPDKKDEKTPDKADGDDPDAADGLVGFDGDGPDMTDGKGPDKDDGKGLSDMKKDDRRHDEHKKIVTVRYYNDTDKYSIRSYELNISEENIIAAAQLAVSQEDSFGKLPGYKLYYSKHTDPEGYSVALTHTNYFHSSALKLITMLVLIYAAAMVLFFILSFYLSKAAARPLEKTMLLEKQFVADISHQLKTPLTVILANNSIIKANPSSPVSEQISWIDNTDAAARRMMSLVENMLTLSSVEFTADKLQKEKCDLSAVVTKAALQMESLAFEKGITPEMSIEESIFVEANKEYLNTICRGLIDNALKYEPDGGQISISLYSKKKLAYICVHNKGSFIPREDIPHIFERFYRSTTAQAQQSGYGLGLAIVKEMTEKSNGTITAQSTKENGTLFTVTLPIQQ